MFQNMFNHGIHPYKSIHFRCRNNFYPYSSNYVCRISVPDDKVPWKYFWPDYKPQIFTAESVSGQPWADLDITHHDFKPLWNSFDGPVNRKSYVGKYDIIHGYPINPVGRTGLRGRGMLGRWGPNHAADPLVTRWKRDQHNKIICNSESKKPILQIVAIMKKGTEEWGIPGGMVDVGETVRDTTQREFFEEALNTLNHTNAKGSLYTNLNKLFANGNIVYRGYVDDPRNTDNAWIETTVLHFHDDSGDIVGSINLNAGDDASKAMWLDLDHHTKLFMCRHKFIEDIALKLCCHW